MNRDEIRVATGAVATGAPAEVTVGSAVPQNFRRFIYRIKFINGGVGANQLLLGKRENGAVGTTAIDTIQAAVTNEVITDPDDLKEESAPLYTVDGPPGNVPVAVAFNSLLRAYTTAGVGIFTYWYVDAPA